MWAERGGGRASSNTRIESEMCRGLAGAATEACGYPPPACPPQTGFGAGAVWVYPKSTGFAIKNLILKLISDAPCYFQFLAMGIGVEPRGWNGPGQALLRWVYNCTPFGRLCRCSLCCPLLFFSPRAPGVYGACRQRRYT